MEILRSKQEFNTYLAEIDSSVPEHRRGFVPTMGALHQGHLSLVGAAKARCSHVSVSIFVNPTQFLAGEDFDRYPRTLDADIEKLKASGVSALFLPQTREVYPPENQTRIYNPTSELQLCGQLRPGHFEGVLTVVHWLLKQARPGHLFMGKKDYQQWRLIERMVMDLEMNLEVHGVQTMREKDGLAMSSRNRYLSQEERAQAARVYQGLKAVKDAFCSGVVGREELEQVFLGKLQPSQNCKLGYFEILKDNLQPLKASEQSDAVALVAVKVGETKLIDNVELHGKDS